MLQQPDAGNAVTAGRWKVTRAWCASRYSRRRSVTAGSSKNAQRSGRPPLCTRTPRLISEAVVVVQTGVTQKREDGAASQAAEKVAPGDAGTRSGMVPRSACTGRSRRRRCDRCQAHPRSPSRPGQGPGRRASRRKPGECGGWKEGGHATTAQPTAKKTPSAHPACWRVPSWMAHNLSPSVAGRIPRLPTEACRRVFSAIGARTDRT